MLSNTLAFRPLKSKYIIAMKFIFLLLLCLVACSTLASPGISPSSTENEIKSLIEVVKNSECVFHRNGKKYSAQKGADHLQLKLRRGAKYAKTTEDFIQNLASSSSWSGKPYLIECKQGEMRLMKEWLDQQLKIIRAN